MMRFTRFSGLCETMALTLVVWLCTLPLVGLIVLPLFGPTAALLAAAGLLLVLLPLCWGMCSYRAVNPKEVQH